MKGKSYNKLQIFVKMDGCFDTDTANMDSSIMRMISAAHTVIFWFLSFFAK